MKSENEIQNPFDKTKQQDKHEFFKQMTSAINDWMLKKYPEFDTQLTNKLKRMEVLQEEIRIEIRERDRSLESIKEKHLNYITGQINEFLKKHYPDISNSLTLIAKELQNTAKKQDEYSDKITKRLNNVIKSDTLYEDVYKMRDEFKEIQKFFEGFKKKIQKAFDV